MQIKHLSFVRNIGEKHEKNIDGACGSINNHWLYNF